LPNGKLSMTISDTQSYSLIIRDCFFDAVLRLPFFATGWHTAKCKQFPIQSDQVPFFGCYLVDETMMPDGDPNAGDIRFIHALRVGFQVVIQNNDPVASEVKLDQAFRMIMGGLWCDQYLMNRLDTYSPTLGFGNPDNVMIEGIRRGTRKHLWGNTTLTNEMPIAELQYEATAEFRTMWSPTIVDDLLKIHVETVPLAKDGTIPPADEVQRIISEHELEAAP
jgi:hypothetical protein